MRISFDSKKSRNVETSAVSFLSSKSVRAGDLTEFPIRASQFRPKAETADFQIENLKTAPLVPPLNTNH